MTDQEIIQLLRAYKDVCETCRPFMVIISGSIGINLIEECRTCRRKNVISLCDEEDALVGDIAFVEPLDNKKGEYRALLQ